MLFRNISMSCFNPACAAVERKLSPPEDRREAPKHPSWTLARLHGSASLTLIKGSLVLLLLGLLIVGLAYLAEAAPPAQTSDQGRAVFEQKCIACHTIGGGKKVGPDLQGVTTRRDQDWLTRWILAPDKMLAQKDPTATQLLPEYNNVPMPNMALSQADVAALLAYFTAVDKGAAAPAPPAATPAALPAGDAAFGKDLFAGPIRFQNGGPPCIACHTIAGTGLLGGGTLGPDLTPAFNKYGESGMATFLSTVPLPTMNAVWSAHPFTPQEEANLTAFLKQASGGGPPVEVAGLLAGLAVVGAVVLVALAQLYWRRRLTAVRRPLVAHYRAREGDS